MKLTASRACLVALTAMVCATAPAHARQLSSFSTISFNYSEWDHTTKSDTPYLQLEAGAEHTWGDLYGYMDFENPFSHRDTFTTKGYADVKLGQRRLMLHTHTAITGENFDEIASADFFAGLAMKFAHDSGAYFKPYLAARYSNINDNDYGLDFEGFNGLQFGFSWELPLTVLGQHLVLAQWHETDFARDGDFDAMADGEDISHLGAVSAWFQTSRNLQLGIQYKYFDNHETAGPGFENAWVASAKFLF